MPPALHTLPKSLDTSPLARPEWRLANLYTIRDANGNLVPFRPNDGQRAFYNARHYCNHILKARKLGFSTFLEIENADWLIFTPRLTAGIIDYKLEDAKKKLRMVRDAYQHLDNGDIHPDTWQLGRVIKQAVKMRSAATRIEFSNLSEISGSTDFRGDTPQRLHISELGKTSIFAPIKADEIKTGALNSLTPGNVCDIETTHEGGRNGLNYQLLQPAMRNGVDNLSPVDFKFHFFPWYLDPRYVDSSRAPIRPKTREYLARMQRETGYRFSEEQARWYDRKQLTQGHGMKKEYPTTPGEAFEAVSEASIYGEWLADLRAAGRVYDFEHERHLPIFSFWDIGLSDYGVAWLIQPVGRAILVLDWHERTGGNAAYWADQMRRWESKYNRPILTHFLPHDADIRDRGSGLTYRQSLAQSGLHNTVVVPRTPDVWLGIGYVKDVLPHCYFHSTNTDTPRGWDGSPYDPDSGEEQFPSGLACLEGYARDLDTTTLRENPLHNEFSHSADAFRTFAEAWRRGMVHAQVDDPASPANKPRVRGPKLRK